MRQESSLKRFEKFVTSKVALLSFFALAVLVRFVNLPNNLFFIWDQGRDAIVWKNMVQNLDVTLIGPTSGIQGFFLGPLWYYVGLPGFLITGGNPYLYSAWFVLLACMAIPFFWLISNQLFKDKLWAVGAALLLAFLPGSISESIFIWNPLISIPLVAAAFWLLLKARESRWYLISSLFLFALTLQSEFAYAVFFIVPLWLLIFWIRGKFDWKDYLYSAAAIAVTFVPQFLFELRNKFIMSQSLIRNMTDSTNSVGWAELFVSRPEQMFINSRHIFFKELPFSDLLMGLCLGLIVLAAVFVFIKSKRLNQLQDKKDLWQWQLTVGLAILPYVGYMFWRGNYGYFFDYYLTPHFIFLIPAAVIGLRILIFQLQKIFKSSILTNIILIAVAAMIIINIGAYIFKIKLSTENGAGLRSMLSVVEKVDNWRVIDKVNQAAVRIFTPNLQTENHDYLFYWFNTVNDSPVPKTIKTDDDQVWYIVMENDPYLPAEARFDPWYKDATASGRLVRREKIGALLVETWMTPEMIDQQDAEVLEYSHPDIGAKE